MQRTVEYELMVLVVDNSIAKLLVLQRGLAAHNLSSVGYWLESVDNDKVKPCYFAQTSYTL